MEPICRGQGRQVGGRAMQFAGVGDDAIVVFDGGGRGGGRHTPQNQIIKNGGGTGHQTHGCCLKMTQLGQGSLSMWKCQISKGPAC